MFNVFQCQASKGVSFSMIWHAQTRKKVEKKCELYSDTSWYVRILLNKQSSQSEYILLVKQIWCKSP